MKKIIDYLKLKNIRQQTEEVRRHILHVLTITLGFILILLWIYSLGTTLTNSNSQAKVNEDLKPFSALKANMVGGYNGIIAPSSDTGQ